MAMAEPGGHAVLRPDPRGSGEPGELCAKALCCAKTLHRVDLWPTVSLISWIWTLLLLMIEMGRAGR